MPYIKVALHPEGVDRNLFALGSLRILRVALPPEGVDRNTEDVFKGHIQITVALHLKGAGRTQIVTLNFWT